MSNERLTTPMQTALVFAARYTHNRDTVGAIQVIIAIKQAWEKINKDTRTQLVIESNEAGYNKIQWRQFREFAEKRGES
jgi:hypothetical protein